MGETMIRLENVIDLIVKGWNNIGKGIDRSFRISNDGGHRFDANHHAETSLRIGLERTLDENIGVGLRNIDLVPVDRWIEPGNVEENGVSCRFADETIL